LTSTASEIKDRDKLHSKFLKNYDISEDFIDNKKDSVLFLSKTILEKDNFLIDSLLNANIKNIDKLNKEHKEEKNKLEKKQKIIVINGVFMLALLLISIVVIVFLFNSKKYIQKQNSQLGDKILSMQAQFDKLVQKSSHEIELRDDAVIQMKELIKRLENVIEAKQKELNELVEVQNATTDVLHAEINNLKNTITESKYAESEYLDRINNVLYYKKRIGELEKQVKELKNIIDTEKEDVEKQFAEKTASIQLELENTKNKLSLQTTALSELQALKETITQLNEEKDNALFERETYFSLMEEYKTSLDNEIKSKKKIEDVLKEILSKRKE
jgi:DNA repair exonuclease SbcCD ATPase subunit